MNYDELQHGIEKNLPIPSPEELWEAIQQGDLSKYTPEQIEQGIAQKKHGGTLLHWAARHGLLKNLPQELLTAENLLEPDDESNTCFHYAAWGGDLDQIPQELLTKENLLLPDKDGNTCLHYAACYGQLDLVPKELLTKENLLQINEWSGKTCLHHAAYHGQLDLIPKELFTEKNLLQSDHENWTCLHYAAVRGNLDQIPPLSCQTLLHLKTHFETQHSYEDKDNILAFLESQLRKAEVRKALQTCDHPAL